jgi:hypothetical protein
MVRPRFSTESAEVIWLIYLLSIYLSNYLSIKSTKKGKMKLAPHRNVGPVSI